MAVDVGILLLFAMAGIAIFFFLPDKKKKGEETDTPGMEELEEAYRQYMKKRMYLDISGLGLNQEETEKQERLQQMLLDAEEQCTNGDSRYRDYLLGLAQEFIPRFLALYHMEADDFIPFRAGARLSLRDKHDILLYHYRIHKGHGAEAMNRLIQEYHLDRGKAFGCRVTAEELEDIYGREGVVLAAAEKEELLAERVYADTYGLGVVDVLRYQKISGLTVGAGGVPEHMVQAEDSGSVTQNHENIWILYLGRQIKLAYLSCKDEKELTRIVRRCYRNRLSGELSADVGGMVVDAGDGSRVTAMRPPYADSGWAAIVRKHHAKGLISLDSLLEEGDGKGKLVALLRLLVAGCQVTAVTGNGGTGKTTLLRALLQFLAEKGYVIRIYEDTPELKAHEYYPEANLITFRETPKMGGQESLNFQKRTDGQVNIIGEASDMRSLAWIIQTGQVNSETSMFTHHAMTARALVEYTRNGLVKEEGFSDVWVAEEQAVSVLRFDIHMDRIGHVDRITEIVPRPGKRPCYECVNIMEASGGGYQVVNNISEGTRGLMCRKYTPEELGQFEALFQMV